MIDYTQDGITHINIYSQGKTALGRMLSNFSRFHIVTPDGEFESVEGYWHWLGIEDCPEKEMLRNYYGYSAKKYGTELKKIKKNRVDEDFKKKILNAIWYKVKRNARLFTSENNSLPFEHYYLFGTKVHDVKSKYVWMIDGIEKMRAYIIKNNVFI
jgi:hypothetical protein